MSETETDNESDLDFSASEDEYIPTEKDDSEYTDTDEVDDDDEEGADEPSSSKV